MAKKNITIGFPEEKLNVLLYFLNREQQNLEPMLEEQLDKLYNRTVPKQTRDFIQFQMTGELAPETEENQEAGQENTSATKEVVKEARRNKRQERQAGQTVVQKPDETKLDENVQEEEGLGMQIGM
ncbi:DUF6103 family protein [Enterocloster bolteae]|uniref:DUF6103 family protein n=1 Tax=Enterocloster bolteae TaxID=208479 RepID=UPI002A81F38F|nr:DUF6103 family protein [Enterocloster bolteae]